ncbi:hypothetical protein ABH920_003707 [Catenulispora sp. EB89]
MPAASGQHVLAAQIRDSGLERAAGLGAPAALLLAGSARALSRGRLPGPGRLCSQLMVHCWRAEPLLACCVTSDPSAFEAVVSNSPLFCEAMV